MSELGNIFDAAEVGEAAGGAAGPDLRARVSVPAAALGDAEGVEVRVPWELPRVDAPDRVLRRVKPPFEEGDRITLRLPSSFPDGGTLKLRGQGAAGSAGGRAGDLLVTVTVDEGAPLVRGGRRASPGDGGVSPAVVAAIVAALLASVGVGAWAWVALG